MPEGVGLLDHLRRRLSYWQDRMLDLEGSELVKAQGRAAELRQLIADIDEAESRLARPAEHLQQRKRSVRIE